MRTALIESYIRQLRASFGPVKTPVAEEELRVLYDAKDYAGMIRHIQGVLRLDMKVRLGLVNKGGLDAPAWVERPKPMPIYGSAAFRQTIVIIYLRKSFLRDGTFEEVVLAVAHELCHIVLDAIGHTLADKEEAVDLTAMLLGFRDFYTTGCQTVRARKSSWLDWLCGNESYQIRKHGYLSFDEVRHAATYMTFR